MVVKWPKIRLRGLEYGVICAAVAGTGFAIWRKNEIITANAAASENRVLDRTTFDKPSPAFTTKNSDLGTCNAKLNASITKAKDLCQRVRDQYGLPGLSVAVSVNGKPVWEEGFGYADIENRVPMSSKSILRIASISKSMTAAMLAPLIQEGKINLDCPIQTYLPNYPKKTFEGEEVTITTRQLLTHVSGIRHYLKKGEKAPDTDELQLHEYYKKDKYDSVENAMELFQNDELIHKPGTKYLYTTHGYTVVSAIIEKLTGTPFPKHAQKMFKFWGLENTYLDQHEDVIYNRARYYYRNKNGRLMNTPYVDNSYKWAGGGFQSNVTDLIQFAHILLASYQFRENSNTNNNDYNGLPNKPFLDAATMRQLWTGSTSRNEPSDYKYAFGFITGGPLRNCLFCKETDMKVVNHSGGAIGATSILHIIFPKDYSFGKGRDEVDGKIRLSKILPEKSSSDGEGPQVKGVVVAMITNLSNGGLSTTASDIADEFKWMV